MEATSSGTGGGIATAAPTWPPSTPQRWLMLEHCAGTNTCVLVQVLLALVHRHHVSQECASKVRNLKLVLADFEDALHMRTDLAHQ
jgi:hypothetical protein